MRNTYLSIITLDINGVSALIKRHRMSEWIKKKKKKKKKQDPCISRLQELSFCHKDTCRLEVKGWKKHVSCKWISKESQNSNTYVGQNRV